MSEIEDPQNASKQDDTQEETAETTEIDNKGTSSIETSDSPELSEKLSETESEEERESIKEEEQKETPSEEKSQKEEASDSAELATIARSASSDMSASMSGTAMKQVEPDEPRIPSATVAGAEDAQQRHVGSGPGTVGEWNSLPVLVERLREALELSLAAGHRRGGDEPTSTSLTEPVDVDRSRARHSMEQALLTGGYDGDDLESKKDELKFLEDLLLSDIQTALSRLRETLERTDVAMLAKHGGVSDPTSKLHLLRLVSSLLSRLQVPEEETGGNESENRTNDIAVQSNGAPVGRRRRAVRHTIGVSAEEIAHARRQLEESSADLARLSDQVVSAQRRELLLPASHNATNGERLVEEIHDKYTKDAINQRQSLRDKNKDSQGDIGAYRRFLASSQADYADRPRVAAETMSDDAVNAHRNRRRRGSVDSCQEKDSDDEETAMRKANEEQSRVTKLAAALRQRAEFLSANRNNKFTAKKCKIKRANTIDIPSYLKLQAGNLGYDNPGCILLRRPIDVSDKITANTSSLVVPPSFHPKTENDKKFLALINRNNETHKVNAAPAFVKSFGYTKGTDAPPFATHENWNSRFSNIKTAFDKSSAVKDEESKATPKPQPSAKRSPGHFAPQTSPSAVNKRAVPIDGATVRNNFPFANANVTKSDAGFRHAPSSLFRKIEKSQTPKSPPTVRHWQRENAPRNTLREKARILFDRDSGKVQSQPPSKFNVNKNSQKSTFPRPPWIEHDRTSEGKSSNLVTENGRLDYRMFCKQFAPFIGKNAAPESKRSQNTEESRKRSQKDIGKNAHRKGVALPSEKLGATNGRTLVKKYPAQESQIEHHYPREPRCEIEGAVRDELHSKKDTPEIAVTRNDKSPFDLAFAKNAGAFNATLRGDSSVPVHASVNGDARAEEARALGTTPEISKENLSRSNEPRIEINEPWFAPRSDTVNPTSELSPNYRSENSGHLILDYNRNYHPASTIGAIPNATSPLTSRNSSTEGAAFRTTPDQTEEREIFQIKSQNENSLPFRPAVDNRSQMYSNYLSGVKPNKDPFGNQVSFEIDKKDFPSANDDALPEEQNIQNQDISVDAGVVTRYTCAIATVASADIPEARSEGIRPESRESFSSSSSQLGSHSRATSSDAAATENEIRRHNMLQQSLVRRLQNERATLNDYRDVPVPTQPSSFNLPTLKFQPPESPKRPEPPPRKLKSPRRLEPPPIVTGLLSVPSASSASGLNRVIALRGQYEQTDGQSKGSVQKERSPIPNDVNGVIDSSDEYLVSCANKPSRSIVLSKSESWHQLALSRGHHYSPRPSQDSLPPQPPPLANASYLPPKPKSKSPSPYRMKKQYEASLSSDSVKKMENKIRRYFDSPPNDSAVETRDSKGKRVSPRDSPKNHGLISLSRSRTMPGICDDSRLHLSIPTVVPQSPSSNLNTADVDKVFDDIFEETTKTDVYHF